SVVDIESTERAGHINGQGKQGVAKGNAGKSQSSDLIRLGSNLQRVGSQAERPPAGPVKVLGDFDNQAFPWGGDEHGVDVAVVDRLPKRDLSEWTGKMNPVDDGGCH